MLRRSGVIQLLLMLVVVVAVVVASAQRSKRRQPRSRQSRAVSVPVAQMPGGLECRVYCSDVKPRTSVAEIVWRATPTRATPQDLEASLAQQGIEVTVYKDGFDRGKYASLFSIQRGRSFSLNPTRAIEGRIPGLDQLTITDVRPVRPEAVQDKSFRGASNVVAVEVEGLEPGLNYFWRVPRADNARAMKEVGEVVRCQAATCPADFQPGQEP